MPARLARGVSTPKHRYVCLSCRLESSSLAAGRTARYQHTGPPTNNGRESAQDSISKGGENNNESFSPSRIGEMIRTFMFKPGKNKEVKGDSRVEHPGNNEQSSAVIVSTPHSKDSTDALQQKLQQKFAAQRRKDMLAMQASQVTKAAEVIPDLPKLLSVPERKPKKSSPRAERLERKRQRKLEKAALGKKATKRSKQVQGKPTEVAQTEVVKVATSTQSRKEGESPTSIIASAGKPQETSGAKGMEANGNDSTSKITGDQTTTSQELEDIMGILNSPENSKETKRPMKATRRRGTSLTETKLKRVVVSILDELQKKRKSQDINSRKVEAMISEYSSQLLARLKTVSGEPSEFPDQSRLHVLLKEALGKMDSPVASRKQASMLRVRKHSVRDSSTHVPEFISLRAALGQRPKEIKNTDFESAQILPSEKIEKAKAPPKTSLQKSPKSKGSPNSPIATVNGSDLEILPVTVDQPPVPRLAYGLERVLFNPGVYQLQDLRSRVYNFDPYLQKIMPIEEFDFTALKEYITSSRDESLNRIAQEHGKRYMGSTSSMTEVLAHFHFLLSQWRPINTSMLSKAFPADLTGFTEFQRIPSAIFLRWKDGSYAIDADKQFATANILSMLGKSMEKLLTLSTDDYERYRKSNPGRVTEEEQFAPESYHYSTLGDFLMRSQLDAHDPRLPGTGMFDLKTRSVVSIRMDVANYEHGVGYEIKSRQGEWQSYEREYYDMIRAAFLKYSLQVRMGRMDGIFVAFHNIERIFGFQYISLPEMDSTLHGQRDTSVGDQEFRLSLDLMNKVLDRATKKYPKTSLRIFFETRDVQTPFMYIFAEPVTEEQVAEIQSQNSAKIQEFERNVLGLTRGHGSETDGAQELDPKWEKIQADVQKAMEKDELSVNGSEQDQEALDEHVDGTECATDRPEVFVHGPLYVGKSAASADDDATAASAGNGEDDGDGEDEDEDDIDHENEREDKEEEGEYGEANEDGDVEESRQQEGLEEFLEVEADINAIDGIEAEQGVGGYGTADDAAAPSEDHLAAAPNDANLLIDRPNEENTLGATSGQGIVNEAKDTMNDNEIANGSSGAESNSIPEGEDQQGHQTQADRGFLDSINQEVIQADTAAKSSPPEDVLAMTLTLRNKVNGNYVLRPENMTASDDWSIEYSLTEVAEQTRARALYMACQKRRSKKMDTPLVPEDAEHVNSYIRALRELSVQGRRWRKQQDASDKKRPVQRL